MDKYVDIDLRAKFDVGQNIPPGPKITDYIVELLNYRGIPVEWLKICESPTQDPHLKTSTVKYIVHGVTYKYEGHYNYFKNGNHHHFNYVDEIEDHYLNSVATCHLHDAADLQLDV